MKWDQGKFDPRQFPKILRRPNWNCASFKDHEWSLYGIPFFICVLVGVKCARHYWGPSDFDGIIYAPTTMCISIMYVNTLMTSIETTERDLLIQYNDAIKRYSVCHAVVIGAQRSALTMSTTTQSNQHSLAFRPQSAGLVVSIYKHDC